MKFRYYLIDQKWQLITFYSILGVISIIISVEPQLRVSYSSLLYFILLATFLYNLYFIGSFYRKKGQLRKWQSQDFESIPASASFEQQIYSQVLRQLEEQYLRQIHERNDAAKEQLEFMTQWFHEIKTPIAVSRLLLETEIDSPSMQEEIDKIEGYVEQALHFSRLNDFNKDYLIQEIDLEKLMKEIIIGESKSFIGRKIKLDLQVSSLTVLSDKKGLTYIVRQVLSNALKYTKENGKITIIADPKSRNLIIRDSGIGIPAEDLPRVFEKGFTGKNGRGPQKSTGMGLYLAKKTAEKLGHTLILESATDNGTKAILHFPETVNNIHQM
ncbi:MULTISPECIES: sensor histidine kinase [Neobacillus]|uniref:histidine kinase n=1 Tax=Neobacillus citreus TaxID=2833578 RepID=A0A942SUI2_9BACI|nr:sensor histidine kinase [Neobacillus citreus]MCH6265478.1 sensor histidine kinase [Neobacillus citreus]